MYGIEPRYNEPLYNEFFDITNITRKPKRKIYLDITNDNVSLVTQTIFCITSMLQRRGQNQDRTGPDRITDRIRGKKFKIQNSRFNFKFF